MRLPKIPLAQTIVQLCIAKQIEHIIISPGSRNAPLTIGFTNHSYFKCYSIVDERAAAFFALGIAQQTQKPTALVCTSGSALLNYYPAVAEAFYSDIPLVILSADRPEHLINIGDGQTIDQKQVYGSHILFEANLSEEGNKQDQLLANEAINKSILSKGPVHINVPFNEPLYDLVNEFDIEIEELPVQLKQYKAELTSFKKIWNSSTKKMVLVGVNNPETVSQEHLDTLANDDSVIVFTETTSNIHHPNFFPSIDKIIAPLSEEEFEKLQPEVLLTFGGMIVSKKIKAFLRTYKPKHHWHIDSKKAFDTFFSLKKHFKCSVSDFFDGMLDNGTVESNYKSHWNEVKELRYQKHKDYLNTIKYSDLKVFESILKSIPDHSMLQCANSSTIRYLQLFDVNPSLKIFCNRGTSGIDGSTSTAIGASVVSKEQTVFITGDLSFFYDSNALWNNYIPSSFRIILINNGGGGIFRILPGHKNTENFDTYFETKHDLNAKHLCDMFGFEYYSASSIEEIDNITLSFYKQSNAPRLIEIFTPREVNDDVLLTYFKAIK
jgi:2-succinyl-5-enolpyruvyl-6-hydroxy-3-cyclohexene-1-carboxylate synthase